MTALAAVHGVLPPHTYAQAQITDQLTRMFQPDKASRALLNRFHASTRVATRHLALPIEEYVGLDGFTAANDAFLTAAVDLGCDAVLGALSAAGLEPADVDVVMSTTTTGIAVPSLDARIATRIGMRADVKRVPLLGLGCVGGAAGVARLHDILLGAPGSAVVLVAVELSSLTLQRQDLSAANMIASGPFGDGAAAVVAVGVDHPLAATGPHVVDTASHLYPGSERAMGWDVGSTGFRMVLGPEVPGLVRAHLADDVRDLLSPHALAIDDISHWICHPGGPKVIDAVQEALGLDHDHLAMTWNSLNRVGNLSSASVLHVFADTLTQRPPRSGDWGVLMAMGPGFCSELVLLRW
ncbi:type III polyketide synthase [Lentzea aerocolonigenes]|uniref:type III polyketide synthase n=1 Tax=Lentzea aerocolonigenes TaxID=68170 RepID=UPI0004C39C51|nr:3-oxoacyl-[acyl-carrier-protein] synthase III C-terminal domain-containing protein [Lentzea aerocolonigenes]MCP2244053.1 isopalmitoylresorcinol synthase [Lentzea aerocolonigenes]